MFVRGRDVVRGRDDVIGWDAIQLLSDAMRCFFFFFLGRNIFFFSLCSNLPGNRRGKRLGVSGPTRRREKEKGGFCLSPHAEIQRTRDWRHTVN